MSRKEYVEQCRYELAGLVLDAATVRRDGTELAMQMRTVMARVDGLLGRAWDAAQAAAGIEPPTPPHANGATNGKPALTGVKR